MFIISIFSLPGEHGPYNKEASMINSSEKNQALTPFEPGFSVYNTNSNLIDLEQRIKIEYLDFLKDKQISIKNIGFEPGDIHEMLFPFQSDLVKWAVRKGKSALWALGQKDIRLLKWAVNS